ncbi:DoxX family protein [Paraburkholderia pallida]|uniref:DoxX family protein n=1 Tax=Paraburkholderia pallida TaxID=2547399 RepID=A0A4P7DAK7_9BURK|nr:DoxX family protein [Paraburkholderia pallida]QBR04467.1 DoxX family protein [Paraburkholderia pallida]
MRYTLLENQKDLLALLARVLLMVLFVTFGWVKLADISGAVASMTTIGAPFPALSAIIAIVMELFIGIALMVGFYTRPFALVVAVYTLGTAIIGHHYWTMTGSAQHANMINFYKNISIIGGLLLLCVTGPGKYSVDRR